VTALKSPTDIPDKELAGKARALVRGLADLDGVLVALSGGVDSSLLAAAAASACRRVLAVTASSAIHPRREVEEAGRIAGLVGCEHLVLRTGELDLAPFIANAPDRCYHCKRTLFVRLKEIAADRGLAAVIEGSNVDDLSDFRPGEKALLELGVLSPLRQADLGKSDIRRLARWMGLPTADRPASACLASRFPYGVEITAGALARVGRLEEAVLGMGFKQVRARYHGDLVRIEVEPEAVGRLFEPALRDKLVQAARREGFRHVSVDLQGYRRGSLNP
jgi:uncharacterized protein